MSLLKISYLFNKFIKKYGKDLDENGKSKTLKL